MTTPAPRSSVPRPRRGLAAITLVVSAVITLTALSPPSAGARPFRAGTYGKDSSKTGFAIKRKLGFNTVYQGVTLGGIAGARASLDRLHSRGMKAVIWLGSFDRAVDCGFERNDAWIRTVVSGLAGHPAIAAYQLGDEVNGRRTVDCTNIPGRVKARTQLIRSIDPKAKTYVTLGMFGTPDYFEYEKYIGAASILGLVVYPCVQQKDGCVWDKIRNVIRAAREDRVPRYWAVMQDFGNSWYRQPTARQLRRQLRLWKDSGFSGYFVYHWQKGNIESKPGHLAAYERWNRIYRST